MVLYDTQETIVAVASAPGNGVRGIVRLSGPRVVEYVKQFFHAENNALWSERQSSSHRGIWKLAAPFGELPCRVLLWPTARSYTRQPTAEIHTVGSPPLLQVIVRQITQAGARIARPGEFTLRAFLAGRLDLTQAEAVLGVIDAQDQRQLERALTQLSGQLTLRLQHLRDQLMNVAADIEAGLDFVDEDIAFITSEQIHTVLDGAMAELEHLLREARAQRTVTDWPRVLLVGRPNTGKSTLANALAGRPLAIVSEIPGTTRDYLEVTLELDGMLCRLVDTAGIETSPEMLVDQAAQRMTQQARERADLIVLCVAADQPLDAWESAQVERLTRGEVEGLVVCTKCDRPTITNRRQLQEAIATSGLSGAGLDALRTKLKQLIAHRAPTLDGASLVSSTATRCLEHLDRCRASLERAQRLVDYPEQQILLATELRSALDELGVITGVIYTEDLLDRVFQRFCIGK